jgi:hypothetical protein
MDNLMMREWFEFRQNKPSKVSSFSLRNSNLGMLDFLK